jgi:hypothetical protein
MNDKLFGDDDADADPATVAMANNGNAAQK